MKKKAKKLKKDILFVPFDYADFVTGNHSAIDHLNEIIWLLIEEINKLKKKK